MGLRVYHRLYTHAAETPGSTGGHIVSLGENDIGEHMSGQITKAVDDILSTLGPSGCAPAFAVKRLAGQGNSLACLVVSYSDIVTDGVGRPGLITHARLIRVPSDALYLDIHALLDSARNVSIESVKEQKDTKGRLASYLDQLEDEVDVRAWHPSILQQSIDFTLLCEFTSVLMAYANSPTAAARAVVPLERSDDAMNVLAAAWATLPIAMQVSCSWALDAGEGAHVTILFGRGGESRYDISPYVRELVRDYLEVLIDSGLEIGSILRNNAIGSLENLHVAVNDLQGAHTIGATGDTTDEDEEQSEMVEVPRMATHEAEPPPHPNVLAAEMLRQQLTVFEQRFQKFIDDRLSIHDGARQYMTAEDGTKTPVIVPATVSWRSVPRGIRYGAIAAAALLLFLLVTAVTNLGLRGRLASAERQLHEVGKSIAVLSSKSQGTQDEEEKPEAPNPRFDPEQLPGGAWIYRLQHAMENQHSILTPLTNEIATSEVVPEEARKDVEFLMLRAAAGTLNGQEGRADRLKLRALLFEYVARTTADPTRAGTVIIDGNTGEISARILDDVKEALKVESRAAVPTMDEFMAEAVLRRAAQ